MKKRLLIVTAVLVLFIGWCEVCPASTLDGWKPPINEEPDCE
jgi:hypothetical protein